MIYNKYDSYFNSLKSPKLANIDIYSIIPLLKSYIINKEHEFLILLNRLINSKAKNESDKLQLEILNTLNNSDLSIIRNICFYYFIKIATFQDMDHS